MTYLILESRAAYCIALGEDGRCVKCANMRYEVGDRVENIVELKMPERRDSSRVIRMVSLCAGLAACVCIAFFGWYQPNYAAYGSLRMSINPDVELTLSRTERVLDAEGLNPDGAALLEGLDFSGMDAAEAAGALVAKSISDGYLSEGGQVTVSVGRRQRRLAARGRRRNAHGARGALRHLRHDPHTGRPRGHHTRSHAKPDADANSDAKSGSDPCANPDAVPAAIHR